MILTVLKRSKSVPEKPLIEFVNDRKITIVSGFPTHHLPTPETRLCLCHVISFHEILEELSAERIIEGLGDEYYNALEEESLAPFKSIKTVQKSENILKAIKRFTYRCIFMTDISKDESLIQFLSQPSFWPLDDLENNRIPMDDEDVHDVFQPDILVCHVGTIYQILKETMEVNRNIKLNKYKKVCLYLIIF
ncbi:hypothetical protein DPMN_186307 [Dreissena polymorpha]|uniref:Uncharacterized protein n=1 Tax=Dreissena polymorpha TaxID=45954 RepID=A0A9D4DMF7_DREPO|nr:hypothetical protein DPMN_186307 [Dreissena polymorpha]